MTDVERAGPRLVSEEDREALAKMRERVEMCLGPLDGGRALEELVWLQVEGVVEHYSAGRATWLWVTLDDDGWVEIRDDGPGLAATSEAQSERAALLRRCTHPHGMFWEERTVHTHDLLRRSTSALVGASAFSEAFELETRTRRGSYRLRCQRGVPLEAVQEVEPTLPAGTRIRFRPDPQIFGETKLDAARLLRRLRELAILCPALTISCNDEVFRERSGVRGWVEERISGPVFSVAGRFGGVLMDLALGFALDGEQPDEQLRSFVSWRERHGAHVDGVFLGLWSAVTGEPYKEKASSKTIATMRLGLERYVVAIVHVFPEEAAWSPDLSLANREVRDAVAGLIALRVGAWLALVPEHAARLRAIFSGGSAGGSGR